MKGQKRFKKADNNADPILEVTNFEDLNTDEARARFRKLMSTTSYCRNFGEKPKAQEDYMILKSKDFKDHFISTILKPSVV